MSYFLAMYLAAWLGTFVFFLGEVVNSIKYDRRTPDKFNWKDFFKLSGLRLIIGAIAMAFAIVYFGDFSKLIFGVETALKINGLIAFILGLSIDRIIAGVIGYGRSGVNMFKRK